MTLVIYCLLAVVLIYAAFDRLDPQEVTGQGCGVGYVYDGDTFEMICAGQGRTARIIGLDTPETRDAACDAELALGKQATMRMRALLASGDVKMAVDGYDRYGRDLVRVTVDGRDVAGVMIGEGLAVAYRGGRRIEWCQKLGAVRDE